MSPMGDLSFTFEPPRGPGCLLARVDYGFAGPQARGWRTVDLQRVPLPDLREAPPTPGLVICHADLLLGWARTRGCAGLWPRLLDWSSRMGLVLECRFPRHAREISKALSGAGGGLRFRETPADGRIPPLYSGLRGQPNLIDLHLRNEWWTGMAAARGGIALLRIAFALAERGASSAPALASVLGVTAGAARSYLRWMDDAALLRREGPLFDFRHSLLGRLFTPGGATPAPLAETRALPSKGWNHLELD